MKTRGFEKLGHGLVGMAALLACADAEPSAAAPGGTGDVAATDSPWWCLDQAPTAQAFEPKREPVAFALQVVEWGTLRPLAGTGLTAKLCASQQFTCETPLVAPYVVTDGGLGATPLPPGIAGVPIMEGFDGFIRFEVMAPPDAPSEQQFVPTNYYLGGTIVGDLTQGPTLMMVQHSTWETMVQASFPDVDPLATRDLGIVMLGAYDCNGVPADDIRIEIGQVDPARTVTPFLLPPSRVPIEQPAQQPLVTGTSGRAGYIGVPPGAVQLRAFRRGEAEPYGTVELGVVPGEVSVASLRPAYFVDANVGAGLTEPEAEPGY
jgi:hypothetical protein